MEATDHPGQPGHRVAGAGRRQPAARAQSVEAGRKQRPVIGVVGRIGGVEDQPPQRARVARRVRLAEQGPVGVAVEEEASQPQGPPHLIEVGGRFGGRVAGVAGAKAIRAFADRDRFLDQAALQGRAVDGARATGAALVEEDQIAAAQQRRQGGDQRARVRRRRRGVAGAAVHRHDRAQRGPLAVGAGTHGEGDPGRAERGIGVADRRRHMTAAKRPRQAEVAAAQHRTMAGLAGGGGGQSATSAISASSGANGWRRALTGPP
jgi:hypothetical protein